MFDRLELAECWQLSLLQRRQQRRWLTTFDHVVAIGVDLVHLFSVLHKQLPSLHGLTPRLRTRLIPAITVSLVDFELIWQKESPAALALLEPSFRQIGVQITRFKQIHGPKRSVACLLYCFCECLLILMIMLLLTCFAAFQVLYQTVWLERSLTPWARHRSFLAECLVRYFVIICYFMLRYSLPHCFWNQLLKALRLSWNRPPQMSWLVLFLLNPFQLTGLHVPMDTWCSIFATAYVTQNSTRTSHRRSWKFAKGWLWLHSCTKSGWIHRHSD